MEDIKYDLPKRKLKYKEANIPFEKVTLPSKGLFYRDELKGGIVEIKYPGVREEDILLTKNDFTEDYNTTLFLNSIMMSDITIEELLPVDVDFLIITAYMISYGNLVDNYYGVAYKVDISQFDIIDAKNFTLNDNGNIDVYLKKMGVNVEVNNLTWGEILEINAVDKEGTSVMSNLLKRAIRSVEGDTTQKEINQLIDRLVSVDSRTIRNTLLDALPRIDTSHKVGEGEDAVYNVFPIGIDILKREL